MKNLLASEPVRVYLYGVIVAVVAVLVAVGLVQAESAPLWLALGAAVLAVPVTESLRSRVTPSGPEDGGL